MVSKKMRREWIVIRRATVRSLFTSRRSRRVDLEEVWCGGVTPRYRICSWRLSAHVLVERGVSSGVRYWRAFANRGGLVSS